MPLLRPSSLPPSRLLALPSSLRLLLVQSQQPSLPTSSLASAPPTARFLSTSRPLNHDNQSSSSTSSSSVDPTEVSHFNALASTWWDPHGSSRLLHLMNPLRHRFINSCLHSQADPPLILPTTPLFSSSLSQSSARSLQTGSQQQEEAQKRGTKEGLRYLDVGCGGGIFAESAARMPGVKEVTGIDPSSEVLAVAMEHARRDPGLQGRLRYLNCGIEELEAHVQGREGGQAGPGAEAGAGTGIGAGVIAETATGTGAKPSTTSTTSLYDIVTLWEVLEHVTSPSSFLDLLTPHVRPGGWFVMSTIARTWTSWFTTKLVAEDIMGIVPQGTHDWNKYIDEPEVRRYFEMKQGWESPRCMGVLYVPGVGWREARGGEAWGNYLWGIRRTPAR